MFFARQHLSFPHSFATMPSSQSPKVEDSQEGPGPCLQVHKRYPEGNGDIVLISSDNVRFYVRSMYLAAARKASSPRCVHNASQYGAVG